MLQNIEEISFKVKTLEKRNSAYGEIVRWAGDLLIETARVSEKFTMPDLQPDQNSTLGHWEQGRSFLNLSELILDWDQAGILYKRLVGFVGEREGGGKQAKGLLKIMEDEQEDIPVLMKAVLSSDGETIEVFSKKFKYHTSRANIFSGMKLPSISGKVLYAKPAFSPATSPPDMTVMDSKPVTVRAKRWSGKISSVEGADLGKKLSKAAQKM